VLFRTIFAKTCDPDDLEADLKGANENLLFHLCYFNCFITLFTCFCENVGMSINGLASCCSCIGNGYRSMTNVHSLTLLGG
jgi:hypothetical protein